MQKVFIVGCNGYIGSRLQKRLIDNGRNVIGITREDDFSTIKEISRNDVVYNCAGYGMRKGDTNPDGFLAENVLLPVKLAKYTHFAGAKLIHLSSYFSMFQTNIYAKSKLLTDEILKTYPNVTIAMLYNCFGYDEYPHRFFAGIKSAVLNETPFVLTTPLAERSLVHLRHVLRALEEIIDMPSSTYHLTDGNVSTMMTLCNDIRKKIYHNFRFAIKDIGIDSYVTKCYTPSKTFFRDLQLMRDIYDDIEESKNKSRKSS